MDNIYTYDITNNGIRIDKGSISIGSNIVDPGDMKAMRKKHRSELLDEMKEVFKNSPEALRKINKIIMEDELCDE